MAHIDGLFLDNVRCFKGLHSFPLAPLTLLVGENSAGKSTVLAGIRLASEVASDVAAPRFNDDPFELGNYDEIAHFHGGQAKRAKEFQIGFRLSAGPKEPEVDLHAAFCSHEGEPRLTRCRVEVTKDIYAEARLDKASCMVKVRLGEREEDLPAIAGERPGASLIWRALQEMSFGGPWVGEKKQLSAARSLTAAQKELRLLQGAMERVRRLAISRPPPFALAPIRSRPRRTYDAISSDPDSEGRHVPRILARLARRPEDWGKISAQLTLFGRPGGLFQGLKVRHLGTGEKKDAAPFQVELEIEGQRGLRNMIDVGYGVSQVLPVLVEALRAPEGSTLLMQQPEVHLHPRAQAALGTFLADACRRVRIITETHSDYLVDRVRLAVRRGVLAPSDVALLYFERLGEDVTVSRIEINGEGRIVRPPPGYRDFFAREALTLLGDDGGE